MKALFWIVIIPLLFVSAFFAIANREAVEIDLWPVYGKVSVPLFLALIGALYAGFILGALIAWWAGRQARQRARQATRRADALQRERDALQAQLDASRPKPQALDVQARPGTSSPPLPAPAVWPSP
jgi:uncharacterized integral membrane protein